MARFFYLHHHHRMACLVGILFIIIYHLLITIMSLSARKDIFSTANNTIMLKMMIRHEHNDCCLAYWMDLMSFVDIDDDDNAYTDICHINPMMMNIECVQFSQDAFSKFRKSVLDYKMAQIRKKRCSL